MNNKIWHLKQRDGGEEFECIKTYFESTKIDAYTSSWNALLLEKGARTYRDPRELRYQESQNERVFEIAIPDLIKSDYNNLKIQQLRAT